MNFFIVASVSHCDGVDVKVSRGVVGLQIDGENGAPLDEVPRKALPTDQSFGLLEGGRDRDVLEVELERVCSSRVRLASVFRH